MRIACSLAARRPEPPMRPMIRLGNLNARPSCPAAAPGSTVWVYLYAAGHRDMPGDSSTGNRRLSGTRAQSGKIADACAKEKPPPPGNGRRTDSMAWGWEFSRQEPERHADSQGTHRCHRKPPPRGADGGQMAWRGAGIYTCMNRTLRSSTYLQGIHQRHSKTAARKTGGGWICGRLRR